MSVGGKIDGLLRGKAHSDVSETAHPDESKNLSEVYQQEFAEWLVSMWERDRLTDIMDMAEMGASDGPSIDEIKQTFIRLLATKNYTQVDREDLKTLQEQIANHVKSTRD